MDPAWGPEYETQAVGLSGCTLLVNRYKLFGKSFKAELLKGGNLERIASNG